MLLVKLDLFPSKKNENKKNLWNHSFCKDHVIWKLTENWKSQKSDLNIRVVQPSTLLVLIILYDVGEDFIPHK